MKGVTIRANEMDKVLFISLTEKSITKDQSKMDYQMEKDSLLVSREN